VREEHLYGFANRDTFSTQYRLRAKDGRVIWVEDQIRVIAKAAVARADSLAVTAVTFSVAAVLTLPFLVWTHAPLAQAARSWPWLLYLGAIATAGAYALYTLGLRHVPASVAGVVTLLEPLTATLLGVWVFSERLGAAGLVGALLFFAAIWLTLPRVAARGVGAAPI